jgi:hypothetical protein
MGLQDMDDRFTAEILAPDELLTISEDGQLLVWIQLHGYFAEPRVRTARAEEESLEPIGEERDITDRTRISITEVPGQEEKLDMKIAMALPFAGLQRVIISLPDGETEGFMDALTLFVNATETFLGEIDSPEDLLARTRR